MSLGKERRGEGGVWRETERERERRERIKGRQKKTIKDVWFSSNVSSYDKDSIKQNKHKENAKHAYISSAYRLTFLEKIINQSISQTEAHHLYPIKIMTALHAFSTYSPQNI